MDRIIRFFRFAMWISFGLMAALGFVLPLWVFELWPEFFSVLPGGELGRTHLLVTGLIVIGATALHGFWISGLVYSALRVFRFLSRRRGVNHG